MLEEKRKDLCCGDIYILKIRVNLIGKPNYRGSVVIII
jgi:hypothetical protein